MTSRRASAAAWSIPALTTALVAVMIWVSWTAGQVEVADVMFALAFVCYAFVGALIASRHPRNPVGWLSASLGLVSAISETLYSLVSRSGQSPGPPGGAVTAAAWVTTVVGGPSFVVLVLLFLVFPDGHLPSRRWRGVAIGAVAVAGLWAASLAIRPGPLADMPAVVNPIGIQSLGGGLRAFEDLAGAGLLLLLLAAAASVVARYLAGGQAQRQQIKWLALAGAFGIAMVLAVGVLTVVADTNQGAGDLATGLLVWAGLVAFPVGLGMAMLRHRLYDIDLVIKRTLVYGSLTAMLLGTYLGSVLLLRLVLSPWTGESDLAVAASTLAVAALFRPLRGRVQASVDRRFYRARYDAVLTSEAFAARLRDELDLETLAMDLRRVVQDTMAPTQVALWLRSTG